MTAPGHRELWRVDLPDGAYTQLPGDPPGPAALRRVQNGIVYDVQPLSGRLIPASKPRMLPGCVTAAVGVPASRPMQPTPYGLAGIEGDAIVIRLTADACAFAFANDGIHPDDLKVPEPDAGVRVGACGAEKCGTGCADSMNCKTPLGVTEAPAALPTDRLEQVIDAYLEDYEMVGEAEDGRDACHVPTEGERILIKDAILGLLANGEWDAAWGELIEQRAAERIRGVMASDQRQRFEAWADDQGFPLKRLETSDGYLDLRTQGAWDAWQACAAPGVMVDRGGER